MRLRGILSALVVLVVAPMVACAGRGPQRPTAFACVPRETRSGDVHMYVVNWSRDANERVVLDAAASNGVVALRYDACHLEVARACSVAASYRYTPVSPKHDAEVIRTQDELSVRIPLGVAQLSGEIASSNELLIEVTRVGRFELDKRGNITRDDLHGDCDGVTHVLAGFNIGAFALSSSSAEHVGGGGGAGRIGGSGEHSASRHVVNEDGEAARCVSSSIPPAACKATIDVELRPVRVAGHLCATNDRDDCERQCDLGELRSCNRFAFYLLGFGYPPDRDRARSLFKRACDEGVHEACNNLGVLSFDPDFGPPDDARAKPLFEEACAAGIAIACVNAAYVGHSTYPRGLPRGALPALERACEADEWGCCEIAAYENEHSAEGDAQRADAIYDRLCQHGETNRRCPPRDGGHAGMATRCVGNFAF